MSFRDRVGIALACIILLAQTVQALPWISLGGWYWPFMSYPMYSPSYNARAAHIQYALEVRGCSANSRWRGVQPSELGILPFRYREMLRVVDRGAVEDAAPARELLQRVIMQSLRDHCEARLLKLSLPLEMPDGGWDQDHWVPLEPWPLR